MSLWNFLVLLLRGTGIFLVLLYIYPIVPYALALCAQFLVNSSLYENESMCSKVEAVNIEGIC